jgi:hypothetical protein
MPVFNTCRPRGKPQDLHPVIEPEAQARYSMPLRPARSARWIEA